MRPWWQDGVIYQIYPRSYADTNGDGIGDLAGIRARLDHLEWLGVDGLWLNPINLSPNDDWGYDVSDYSDVHPRLGTLADARRLVEAAAERGIRVMLDLVPNHTSDQHPWFVDSRSSRDARTATGTCGPTASPTAGRQQLAERLRRARVDASTSDRPVLPAQLPAGAARPELVERGGARRLRRHPALLVRPGHRRLPHRRRAHDREGPASCATTRRTTLDDHRRLEPGVHAEPARGARRPAGAGGRSPRPTTRRASCRRDARARPGRAGPLLRRRRRAPARLQLRLPARGVHADALAAIVDETEAALPSRRWPVWTLSNHDLIRFPTRWAGGDPEGPRSRCSCCC